MVKINEATARNLSFDELAQYGSKQQIADRAIELAHTVQIDDPELEYADQVRVERNELDDLYDSLKYNVGELLDILAEAFMEIDANPTNEIEIATLRKIKADVSHIRGKFYS